ncbi:hypothetical protein PYCCODRAFT_1358578 [Trametes coccinea BRFM310]|uniref:2OGFeDO JBP1/TET oxygenase domain-containing protein n=1 Tax=Trametes coccinea (strain BRFM310) TaxID=1353009 RepID=A0A1Y2J445_TRAC3|nr:hypothetical protein PYCCODRAFT_1358578 [Trametes coccinea BRFM310]
MISDGNYSQCRPVLDRNGRVFAVLGGQPRDQSWADINRSMCRLFEEGRTAYTATTQQTWGRRGDYTAVNVGISFGGGQQHVSNLAHTQSTQAILDSILQQSPVRRIASFQSSVMRLFAPRLHSHYSTTLDALCARHPHLRRNFTRSAFGCMTLNMGPRTKTIPHRDHLNLPHGWCAITALGTFDPKCGGHLILWELRMVVEFPPGSTILIPSAILTHSNTNIALDERRYSLTQYSAGGLFRWVACGFQSATSAGITAKHLSATGQERWEEALQLLSHWSELLYQ